MSTNNSVPSLERAWINTVLAWNNPKVHEELFQQVRTYDAWSWAARCYRDHAKAHPGDVVAARQLRQIQAVLMAALTPREKPVKNPYRRTISILVMLVATLGIGTAYTQIAGSSLEQTHTAEVGEIAPEPEQTEIAEVPSTNPVVATLR